VALNSPAYQELERLLPLLRADAPAAYKAVVAMCLPVVPSPGGMSALRCGCAAARDRPAAQARSEDGGARGADGEGADVPGGGRDVAAAVAWLEAHWRGEPFIPDELQGVAAVA
jgi:hypothetical protein